MRFVSYLLAIPFLWACLALYVRLIQAPFLLLLVLLAFVGLTILFDRRRENRHDPWSLAAAAFTLSGGLTGVFALRTLSREGGNPSEDPFWFDVSFVLLLAGFLLALVALVSLHFRPRRRGAILAFCCLVQGVYAAALPFAHLYGPTYVENFYYVPPVELASPAHAWTAEWVPDPKEWELRMYDGGDIYLVPPPRTGRIQMRRPSRWHAPSSVFHLDWVARSGWHRWDWTPGEESHATPWGIALFVEPGVPWRWVESELEPLICGRGGEEWPYSWGLDLLVEGDDGKTRRSLPVRLVPPRDLRAENGAGAVACLVIAPGDDPDAAPFLYGLDDLLEPDPEVIAALVREHWELGGILVLDLHPELPWADVVDFLDRAWKDTPSEDRVCRVALVNR